jgi:glutaredoxin
MNRVVLISKPSCPWCDKAKNLLIENLVDYYEMDLTVFPQVREFLVRSGLTTVPVIYESGQLIGGYTELKDYLSVLEPDPFT